MKILVTGGCGYIGSHVCCELLTKGYEVVIVDNLCNSNKEVIDSIKNITNKNVLFYEYDLRDREKIKSVFTNHKIDAVIHFAGLKAVGESVANPLMYYENNIGSSLVLFDVMKEFNCKNIVFSSSATVYGEQEVYKYVETMKKQLPTSPYGKTKDIIENILIDLYNSDNEWNIMILRYFNPIGAHKSGLIGDNPNGIPNNLMPYILKVATNKLDCLTIFGNDYDTPDGTCIRDYIHVVDLSNGHIKALEKIFTSDPLVRIYNLGSGKGISVQEIVDSFERVNNLKLNYKYGKRRDGDLPEYYADASKALSELGWKTEKSLDDMCLDSYNFILKQK